jgi:hypothetical protein
MEIIGINRGKIKVIIEGKSLIITGELTCTPAFYADISSIQCWEPPFENEIIDENTKKWIIDSIIKYAKDKEIKVYFD